MDIEIPKTLEAWNASGKDYLPGHFNISFQTIERDEVIATLPIVKAVTAWNNIVMPLFIQNLYFAEQCKVWRSMIASSKRKEFPTHFAFHSLKSL